MERPQLMEVTRFGQTCPVIYIGEVRASDGAREGRGIEIGPNTIIEGWFLNNQPNGFCRFYLNSDNDFYEGYMK